RSSLCGPGFVASPVKHIDEVAQELFVGNAIGGFGRELYFGAEMFGELAKEIDAFEGVELVAAQQGLDGQGGFAGRHALAQTGGQVRILAQRIEFSGEKLVDVGFDDAGNADDDRIGGDIAEALATRIEPAGQTADEIKHRQRVDEPEQVTDDDLVKLEAEAFGIDDAQAAQHFAEGLSAQAPFEGDPVTDADDKIGEDTEGRCQAGAENLQESEQLADDHGQGGHASQ